MKFEFFESLTRPAADLFLAEYLSLERHAFESWRRDALSHGILPNLTLASIQPVFGWIANDLRTLPRAPEAALPEWIRQTASYRGSLFDFDEASNILIMRASFYYGEAFVQSLPELSWSVGKLGTALMNMPVVTGFNFGLELPPILVAENLFMDIISGSKTIQAVEQTVEVWRQKAS